MSSEAEAECGGVYMNAQESVPFITTLEELGHPQESVMIRTDNITDEGIMNRTVKQTRIKHMDMRFYWVQD